MHSNDWSIKTKKKNYGKDEKKYWHLKCKTDN